MNHQISAIPETRRYNTPVFMGYHLEEQKYILASKKEPEMGEEVMTWYRKKCDWILGG